MSIKKVLGISIIPTILLVSILTYLNNMILHLFILAIISISLVLILNKFEFEKVTIILFFFMIPFIRDYDFKSIVDYHVVTKPYYTFSFVQIFSFIFLLITIKKIKNININIDLIFLAILNIICFISSTYAINLGASFFDAFRIFTISILYVYFSRIFDYKKYKQLVIKILILTAIIQFLIGILQIIVNGPIGLNILGEGKEVFRAGVNGFEKGMSGTFGHPGPFALYSLLILSFVLFDKTINNFIRTIGIIICTLNVIISAGRTCMILMAIVYGIYYINSFKFIDIKKINSMVILFLFAIVVVIILSDEIVVVLNRFLNSDMSDQFANRLYHYEIAFKYIKEKPLFGWGLNNYLDLSYYDHPIRFYTNFFFNNPIHNAYLLYAVEIGIIGSLLFILFLFNNFRYYKNNRRNISSKNKDIFKGYIVGIIIYFIYNLQGWGGIQTRSLVFVFILNAFLYNINEIKRNQIT